MSRQAPDAHTRRRSLGGRLKQVASLPIRAAGVTKTMIGALAALGTGIVLILQTVAVLPDAWSKAYHTFYPTAPPSNLVIFVSSDQSLASSYLDVLNRHGIYQIDYEYPTQVDDLVKRRPGLVIIGDSSVDAPAPTLTTDLRQLLTSTRVLGMGAAGAHFFADLDASSALGLRHAVGVSSTEVKLAPSPPEQLASGLPRESQFAVYRTDDQSGQTIHDTGTLDVIQARRLAEANVGSEPCGGHFWSLMQQGDDYFWGYSLDAGSFTDYGETLFVNLVKHMLASPVVGSQSSDNIYAPGSYEGTVTCNYPVGVYPLRVTEPGTVSARVTSKQPLELTLSQAMVSAQVDKIERVSPSLAARASPEGGPQDWLVTVSYRGHAESDTTVHYVLEVDYPDRPASRWPTWALFAAVVVSVLMIGLGAGYLAYGARVLRLHNLILAFRKRPRLTH